MEGHEKQTVVWAPGMHPQRQAGGRASVSRAHLPLNAVFVKTQAESLSFPVHLLNHFWLMGCLLMLWKDCDQEEINHRCKQEWASQVALVKNPLANARDVRDLDLIPG